MNTLICLLALAAASAIFMFDKQGQTHKPVATVIAWLYFVLFASVATVSFFEITQLRNWLLVGILAMNSITLMFKKGNITELFALPCQHSNVEIKINQAKPHKAPHKRSSHHA